jgi:flagellin-like protein
MQIRNLFADEDAVSPVIGVILMVAITVILAAVIGAFVLGIGGSQEQTPQASWEWNQQSGAFSSADITCSSGNSIHVQVTHQGGDEINAGQLTLGGESCSGTATAGISLQTDGASSSDTINLVWKSSSSDSTSILSSYTVS